MEFGLQRKEQLSRDGLSRRLMQTLSLLLEGDSEKQVAVDLSPQFADRARLRHDALQAFQRFVAQNCLPTSFDENRYGGTPSAVWKT